MKTEAKPGQRPWKKALFLLLLLLVIGIDCCISFGFFSVPTEDTEVLNPDIIPSVPSEDVGSSSDGNNQVNLTVGSTVEVSLSEGNASLLFHYPEESNQKIQLQLYVQDQMIAASDYLEPGSRIDSLTNVSTSQLREGEYSGSILVICFDADTMEKSKIQCRFPVIVTARP